MKTENSPEPIHSAQDAVKGYSWQTKANGGHVESVEIDIVRIISDSGNRNRDTYRAHVEEKNEASSSIFKETKTI